MNLSTERNELIKPISTLQNIFIIAKQNEIINKL
ncbi:hypothetical protein QE441_000202 [Chryseobacterium sp. SORGH_AS909]|uniref:Uncharacterized protein n=1 Tax=Chryseobacterium camelliae TaxID=1265445 RepID=A0ABU0TIY8_9FLAO|nr:hypothetical protein [Chryseobacterium camelliae]MDQ1100966.1 hypothetical protein [Chryseobacterium sp. SORGH_AS_1048]MDR6084408.1 hypothetical protein [Chryseobacterium sp. SORGH_AS_0909]MDR6132679.1 hypothetical protein [Chryseobacterium sp. SORGH_AS_1175]MDT3409115.1 hypothetical protein [Pseudacidovorax intermedius]